MYLSKLGGKGFLGYKRLDLEVKPGLTLIDGVNHHFATASSNASGKSTLQEIIAYSAFGKTIRGLELNKIIHKGSEWASAYTEYVLNDGKTLRLERYRNHPKLNNNAKIYLDGADISGRYVKESSESAEQLLGFDFSLLQRAVIIHSRKTESFGSVKDRYIKQITEKLIGMPDFDPLLENVKDNTKRIEYSIERMTDRIGFTRQSIEEKKNELEQLKQKSDEAQVEIDKLSREANDAIIKIKSDSEFLRKELTVWEQLKDRLIKIRNAVVVKRDALAKKLRDAETVYAAKNASLDLLLKQKKKYDRMEGICPECGQQVSSKHIKLHSAKINLRCIKIQKKLKIVKSKCDKLEASVDRKVKRENELSEKISEVKTNITNAQADLGSVKQILIKLEEDKKKKENPYTKLIEEARNFIRQKREELEETKLSLFKRKKTLLYYQFWRRGFGPNGIRSYMLDAVNPEINRIANIYLDILTDGNMWLSLNTVKMKKDGTYSDRFEVEIENLSGADVLGGGSDGELHSVDLALNFAMSDILETRMNGFGFMFIDQALDLVDSVRGRKAIRLLNNKLDEEWCSKNKVRHKRTIWLISHREALKDLVEDTLRVEKKGGVCRLITV